MDIKLLKSSILSNTIPNFIIFYIEEVALYKQYIKSIANTLNKEYKVYKNVKEILYDIESGIKDDCIYVTFDDVEITESVVEDLIHLNKNIILCYSNNKFNLLKKYDKYVVKFNKLSKETLLAYGLKLCKNNKCSITQDNIIKLIEYCNNDLGIFLNELDKIFLLEQENSNVLVEYLLNEGFIDYRDINIWKFIYFVIKKDKRAFDYFLKLDESPVTIIHNIYSQALNELKNSRNNDYIKLLKLCFKVSKGILDGSFDSEYAIKYILLGWFS